MFWLQYLGLDRGLALVLRPIMAIMAIMAIIVSFPSRIVVKGGERNDPSEQFYFYDKK